MERKHFEVNGKRILAIYKPDPGWYDAGLDVEATRDENWQIEITDDDIKEF